MLLETIHQPADLRSLGAGELGDLAREIRQALVASVAATGGHLGSNLGVVELTLALHRVFDSPHDAVLWDTGHQAYVHKMVTGRHGRFGGLRQAGGLSGYPSRAESEHDLVENSHASTILSYAYGLTAATVATEGGSRRLVVAVIGDGALTGGLAYEALNNIGYRRAPVVIVLNDNGRSYAQTVSPLWSGEPPKGFFEALGVDYLGPVDGHDVAALEEAFRQAAGSAGSAGPVAVHVRTVKGKGYQPAEDDPVKCLHDTASFDPTTGLALGNGAAGYTEAFGEAMVSVGGRYPDVVALTAAMPGSTGLLDFAEQFPDRFHDVGIAEQHAVTAAAGMAMGGLRPVVAVYSTFLNRAWDQIYYDVGLHGLPVVFCLDRAGVTGDDGASHHGVLDLALLTKVPGMTVLAPSSYEEVGAMLETALSITSGPVAIRWPKGAARRVPIDQIGEGLSARRLRAGADVCLLAVGKLVGPALEAADLLAEGGASATVWDVRSVRPLDARMLDDAAAHRAVVSVEDGVCEGGAGAHVVHELRSRGDEVPVTCLGTPVAYLAHAKPDAILAGLGLDAAGIAESAVAALRPAGVASSTRL